MQSLFCFNLIFLVKSTNIIRKLFSKCQINKYVACEICAFVLRSEGLRYTHIRKANVCHRNYQTIAAIF